MHASAHTPWADLEVFLTVAESGSFSRAARALRLTQPTVSRRIQALEEKLGRPLFRRDVEGAHLTQEGALLLPAAEQMARWARELDREAAGFGGELIGSVRVATPPGIAYEVLTPFARLVRADLPDLRIELITGIEHIDLSRGQAELAIRSRRPTQPDLMQALSLQMSLGVFGSAEYVAQLEARHGPRIRPNHVDWITWAAPYEHLPPRPELTGLIAGFQPVFASNDYLIQERAVALGLGAMILPRIEFPHASHAPFVEIDLPIPLPRSEMFVVCAKSMRRVPRVATIIARLATYLRTVSGLSVVEHD